MPGDALQNPMPRAGVKLAVDVARQRKAALVLGVSELEQIVSVMKERTRGAPVSVEAGTADGARVQFATIAALAAHENGRGKRIQFLELSASGPEPEAPSISIGVSAEIRYDNVVLHALRLPEDEAASAVDALTLAIDQGRQWYTWIWRWPAPLVMQLLTVLLFGTVSVSVLRLLDAPSGLVGVAGAVAGAGGGALWQRLRERLFPLLRILVGEDRTEWESKRGRRVTGWVAIGLLLPFALFLAVSAVAHSFG